VIASGIHTFGIFQRLAVTNVYPGWVIIAGSRMGDLVFTMRAEAYMGRSTLPLTDARSSL